MQYKLIKGASLSELETLVNEAIAEGWVPQGGVAFTQHPQQCTRVLVQAMVLNQL